MLDAYGIDWKNYEIEEQSIQRNQTFSTILAAHSVPTRVINQVIEKARPVFNLRHLQAGKPLRIYQDVAGQAARLVVYQPNPEKYIVFDLRDSLKVYEGRHPVIVSRRAVSGVITASPYQTLEEQGANPALAVYLSKVFAWQIDFYRIRRGDRFTIIYDEREVAGKSVGVKIIATRFEHADKDFYAFHFDKNDDDGYYDEQGRTTRRAFLPGKSTSTASGAATGSPSSTTSVRWPANQSALKLSRRASNMPTKIFMPSISIRTTTTGITTSKAGQPAGLF